MPARAPFSVAVMRAGCHHQQSSQVAIGCQNAKRGSTTTLKGVRPVSAGLDTRPNAITYDLEELVEKAWAGQVRIPHFQRPFRWGREDVRRLFDSVLKGYPIGSVLLWLRPAPRQELVLGNLRIDAEATDHALWVVDGQQRITSLANALHPQAAHDSSTRMMRHPDLVG
jgi:hypothetical protein